MGDYIFYVKDKKILRGKTYIKYFKSIIVCAVFLLTVLLWGCSGAALTAYEYTFNTYVQAGPKNWSCHNWETQADALVQSYCEMGLVDIVMGADGNFEWAFEMARDITDVTHLASEPQRQKWNITQPDGRMFKISLNPDAAWQDGTPINADTYIYSMQQLLSKSMKNTRSDLYRTGENAIFNAEKWYCGQAEWCDVGLYKLDDYTLMYVTAQRQTMFAFLMAVSYNWIVYEPLYEQGKRQMGGRTVTDYGTDGKSYMAYGPYALVSFEKDKQLIFQRNESWYGYKDGAHRGQFQTKSIRVSILPDKATVMQMFQKGELDVMQLSYDDIDVLGQSDGIKITPQSYSMRFSFNTDLEVLKKLESSRNDGNNLQILANTDFRRAISLCFDRESWCREATAGHYPQVGLLSDTYYYDIQNHADSVYRNTPQAMQAIIDLYGIKYGQGARYESLEDAYKSVSGYDITQAKRYFDSAFENAVKDGTYNIGQRVVIHIGASASAQTAELSKQERMFNTFLENGTKGTGFEGLVSVKYVYNLSDRYGDTASGIRECCYGGLGGAAFFPYRGFNSYIDDKHAVGGRVVEGNFKPKEIMLDITCNFDDTCQKTVTKSLYDWNKSINGDGQYCGAPHDVKLSILAAMEKCILENAHLIPVTVSSSITVLSDKIKYGSDEYNVMYGFGGVRHMTYN